MFIRRQSKQKNANRGFTIIEAVVSISIFVIVMLVSASALLSIIDANKKSHELKSVMDNLNFSLDSIVRDIRVGSSYSCGMTINAAAPNCNSYPTAHALTYISSSDGGATVSYYLQNGQIFKLVQGSGYAAEALTDSHVNITDLEFYVNGAFAGPSDGQPTVTITVDGVAGSGKTQSDFELQTSVTQRQYD